MPTALIDRFCSYLDSAPSPFHAARQAAAALNAQGYTRLDRQAEPEPLEPGHGYYTLEAGTLIAFRVGTAPAARAGFRIIAAHTDSPNLRIKPNPYENRHGIVRLGVEVYGGVLQATWADRDLGIAGRVALRDGTTRLVHIQRPVCRIPNLAIHLQRTVNKDGLVLNAQTQLSPMLSLSGKDKAPLHRMLAEEVGCAQGDLAAWDLNLFDLTGASVGGADGAFLSSGRLDNLASCHAGLEALIGSSQGDAQQPTAILGLFDHEEIGSQTTRGARSRVVEGILRRILRDGPSGPEDLDRAMANSWLLSADMAHAVHPGFADKHDKQHMPMLGAGPVIKRNANWRYGTEADSAAMFVRLCEEQEAPWQWFVNRSDLACGSTVGPILSANLGIRTVDAGNPMLSMHSARETCGANDHAHMARVMQAFFAVAGPGGAGA